MLPLSPSNPSAAGAYASLKLEDLLAEVEGDRRACAARPASHRRAPRRLLLARQGTDSAPIRRGLGRAVRSGLAALAALALTLCLAGPASAASVTPQDGQPAPAVTSTTAPEHGSRIIAVLIGL